MKKAHMKILVPIDFSEESMNGLVTAVNMAKNNGGEIIIFHVLSGIENILEKEYQGMASFSKAFENGVKELNQEKEKTKSALEALAIEKGIDDVPHSTKIVSGNYNEELKNYLFEHDISIIVMGISSNNSLEEYFSGNKAEQSIRLAKVPVLAVKKMYRAEELTNLLLGIELKAYDFKVIEELKKFAEYLGMKLFIVYVKHSVFEDTKEILRQLKKFAEKHELKNYTLNVMPIGEPRKRLEEFTEKNEIDMIATVTKGEKGLFKLIFGSQTDEMIHKSKNAVLSIQE